MWRKKNILILLLAGVLIVLMGEVVPRMVISHNIDKFYGPERAFAASAWREAHIFFSGSAEPLFLTAIQVHDVVEKLDANGQTCYEAVVRAYTLYGLPWSSVFISSCNGFSMIRERWGGIFHTDGLSLKDCAQV
jgi:hypothetical protein